MAEDKEKIKRGIKKLEELGFDELSDKDLEDVAGGETSCSYWCCSDGGKDTETTEVE